MNKDPISTGAPRAAATLMLLRDSSLGPEILLLKRHGLSDAFGDAFVFPGGKLDPADVGFPASLLDESLATLQHRLAESESDPATAAGLFVAAIREACEECGILVAHLADRTAGEGVRSRLLQGDSFQGVIESLAARLATSELIPWSRWITPASGVQAKRFDARFFIARAPRDAIAFHDGRETTESLWLRPREALRRYVDNEIQLAPAQIMTLDHLARFPDVKGLLDEARSRPPFLVQPEVHRRSDDILLCFPGDAGHSVARHCMPGPSRLAVRDRRYVPEGGLEVLVGQ